MIHKTHLMAVAFAVLLSGCFDYGGNNTGGGFGGGTGGSTDGGPTSSPGANVDGGSVGGGPVPTSCSDYSNNQPPVMQRTIFSTVHAFVNDTSTSPSAPHGQSPEDAVVEGPDGNLYGVTRYGGTSDNGSNGRGVVFRLSPAGEIAALHTFDYRGGSTVQGENPVGALVVGPDCSLYGTTLGGWNAMSTVFRITPAGQLSYVAGFDTSTGFDLFDRLTVGSDGNFYGNALHGGAYHNQVAAYLTGTVFKLTPEGTVTVLVSFNGTNGGEPRGGLVEADDGYFYGVTSKGGAYGKGTVFKVNPAGHFQTLHSFEEWTGSGHTAGNGISGGLVKGVDGNFYGTTIYGGAYGGGTIFRITPAGAYTTMHSFNPVTADLGCNCGLASPYGPLLLASDGNFYGVAWTGMSGPGSGEAGAVFRMTPTGTVTPVVYFQSGTAAQTLGGLIESSDGSLYGASSGSSTNDGEIFRIRLAP